jgi:hypothetical protein
LDSPKTFHRVKKCGTDYEHNNCGLLAINLISPPQKSMEHFGDQIQTCPQQCQDRLQPKVLHVDSQPCSFIHIVLWFNGENAWVGLV